MDTEAEVKKLIRQLVCLTKKDNYITWRRAFCGYYGQLYWWVIYVEWTAGRLPLLILAKSGKIEKEIYSKFEGYGYGIPELLEILDKKIPYSAAVTEHAAATAERLVRGSLNQKNESNAEFANELVAEIGLDVVNRGIKDILNEGE